MSSASSSGSPSASFTLKPKRVKFVDGDAVNVGGGTVSSADAAASVAVLSKREQVAEDPVNVEFTISMKKPRGSLTDSPRCTDQDYQSRIKELSQELSKAKEKIDVLEAKNKEIDSMVSGYCPNELY